MLKKLFRKKNINSKSDEKLNRCLTSFDLTLLGVGCIIGTGIFVLTGIAAANQAGPAVILSFLCRIIIICWRLRKCLWLYLCCFW
jgi:APA family basic amino acid/polyamine antiporter